MMCNTEDGRGDYENLRKICTQIDLVSIEDVYGRNSLQRAVIDNKLDFVSHLLTLAKLHQPSVDTLIFHRDCQGKSSLHYALECHNIDILFTLLFNLSDEWKNSANWLYRPLKSDLPLDSICPLAQLLKLTDVCKQINLISVTDNKGCNVLQQCVISDNMNLVFQLLPLAQFHRESLDELIGHTSNKGLNAIQYALLSNNSRVTERLMSSLSETNKNTVCQVTDTHGNNLLHLAASLTPSVDIANTLYSLMDSAVMKRLRKQTNMYGETPRDVKSAQLIRFHVSSLVRPILSKSTQNSLVSAIVSMAVKSDDLVLVKELCLWFPRLVKQWLLTNLCNTPMATAVIEVMSSVSDHFIIPPVQKKARKYAFVCYTSVQRKGALGEAETLAEVLRSKGFIVDLKEWKCFGDLRNWLVERTNKVRSRCSVVSVCLLSHGFGGNLIGENNSRGEIAEIIDETRKVIPPMIPLLIIVQACQKALSPVSSFCRSDVEHRELEDVLVTEKDDSNHMILRAKNCIVLMSTLYDSTAHRNHFVSAIREEFTLPAGQTNIYDLFVRVAHRMSRHQDTNKRLQNPEFRSSAKHHLFL